jgi:glutathione S-transferase
MAARLFAHPFSSYCQKVLIAFYEKGVAYDLQMLSSDNPSAGAELARLWPIGRFPLLDADGRTLLESSVIVEWVDLQPSTAPRLIPADPQAALDVRMRDRIFDNYVMTPMQAIVFDRLRPEGTQDAHGVAQAHVLLDKSYAWLDAEMASRPWACGEDFTLADCAAAPALFYADWVHPIDGFAHLRAYIRRLRTRPSVARAIDEARPFRHFFPGGAPADRD